MAADYNLTAGVDDLREERLARVLAEFSDRLNSGEKVDRQRLLAEHRDLCPELKIALDALREVETSLTTERPLGTLGDYRITREIGRGGMGIVYEAWQVSMERRVALKVLPAALLANEKAVARFEREARVAGRLQHPNIVPVFGMAVGGGAPYYAMEFVEGETLDAVLQRVRHTAGSSAGAGSSRGRSPSSTRDPGLESSFDAEEINLKYCLRVAESFVLVAEALQHAHQRGVIHRDLKPSNLILDQKGQLRILDFGLAHLEGQQSLTLSGEFLGTPLYMSPEQAMANRVPLDHRTDIYSLGVTLYEMLARRPPFRGRDYKETLSQIISRDPPALRPWNSRIPKNLETIVLKCLRKDPADRYGTAEALAQDLRRFVRGDPIEARPQPAIERLIRRAAHHKWRLLAFASAALLALTTGTLMRQHHVESLRRVEDAYSRKVLGASLKLHLGRPPAATQLEEPPADAEGASQTAKGEKPTRGGFLLQVAFAEALEAPTPAADPIEEAVEDLAQAIHLFPQRPDAHYHRARGLHALGRDGGAMEELEIALAANPGFTPAAALREVLREPRPAGRAPETDSGGQAARGPPGWAEAWLQAHRAFARKEWKQAVEAYGALLGEQAGGKEPYLGSHLETLLGRGRAYLELGELDRALADFAAARALWPELHEPSLLVAKTYYLKRKPNDAEETLKDCLRRPDARARVPFAAADLYFGLREYEVALRWAERADDGSARERVRGNVLAGLGRLDEAARAARRSVDLAPRDPRAHETLGFVLFRRGETAAAADALARAVELDPASLQARRSLAFALGALGKPDEARAQYEEALRRSPRSTPTRRAIGSLLYRQGKFAEALEEYRKVFDVDPADAGAHSYAGEALRRLGRLDEALAEHARAVELEPRSPDWRNNLGVCLCSKGDQDGGESQFRQALEADPRYRKARLNLAAVLLQKKKVQPALQVFHEGLALAPGDAQLHAGLARACEANGLIDEAAAAWRSAIQSLPGDARLHVSLGKLLATRKRDYAEAASEYRKAIGLDPANAAAHYNLLLALAKSGRSAEALEAATKALSVLELHQAALEDPERRSWLLHVLDHLAKLSVKAGKPAESRGYVERSLALQKGWAELGRANARELNQYAWTLLDCEPKDLRDPPAALVHAKRAVELSGGNDSEILDTLALAHFENGDAARAVEIERKALSLLPPDGTDRDAALRKVIVENLARFEGAR